jgi:hypothetical protein
VPTNTRFDYPIFQGDLSISPWHVLTAISWSWFFFFLWGGGGGGKCWWELYVELATGVIKQDGRLFLGSSHVCADKSNGRPGLYYPFEWHCPVYLTGALALTTDGLRQLWFNRTSPECGTIVFRARAIGQKVRLRLLTPEALVQSPLTPCSGTSFWQILYQFSPGNHHSAGHGSRAVWGMNCLRSLGAGHNSRAV